MSLVRKLARNVAGKLRQQTCASSSPVGAVRSMGTVQESMIHLTFVDNDGNRASVPALVGSTLLEVAMKHGIDIEGPCGGGGGQVSVQRSDLWHDSTYGEGPTCFFCHVQIPSSFGHLLPPMGETDAAGLEDVWEDEITTQSRLACQITVDERHDGMVVFVPDAPPADII